MHEEDEMMQITVSTTVPVPQAQAWEIFTVPEFIARWNFASDDWHCPSASVDLREGGRHSARMEARDGSFGFDFEGSYADVDPPRSLTLVLDDGRKARTTFEKVAGGTLVQTTFDAEAENSPELQRGGWQAILDNFGRIAAKHRSARTGN
jgi:uncharacterized protein YndB with AHSA1/START domain